MRHRIVEEDLDRILAARVDWSAFDDATVLVTGANGFLPAYVVETLLRRNEARGLGATHVIGLVRNEERGRERFRNYEGRPDFALVVQDVCEPFQYARPINFIVHAASQASPKYYGVDPTGTLGPNVLGTRHLLEMAREHPVRSFLFVSSGEVYGHVSDDAVPTDEGTFGALDPMDVRSCYAESKRMGETMCAAWWHQHGAPAKAVRPFHTYGPGMRLDDGRVFADFVADIVQGRHIVMRSDGKATRAFCYLADAIEGFFTVLLHGENGQAYNVGNDACEVAILKLAEMLTRLFPEKGLRVISDPLSASPGYMKSTIARSCPNTAKLRALGWRPRTPIEEGFARTVRSYAP